MYADEATNTIRAGIRVLEDVTVQFFNPFTHSFLPKGAVNDESSLFLTLPLNMSSLSVEGDDNDDPCGTTVYVLVYLLNSRFTL